MIAVCADTERLWVLSCEHAIVRVRDLRFGTYVRVRWFPCGSYVNFYGLAMVAIQGLTWVNF